jgi:hypothetical protein
LTVAVIVRLWRSVAVARLHRPQRLAALLASVTCSTVVALVAVVRHSQAAVVSPASRMRLGLARLVRAAAIREGRNNMAGGANPQNVQAPNFGGNVFQQSQQALTGALQGTTAAGMNMPDISAFQNPYNQQVIDTTMADLERQRLMQQNQLGAQATAARAFGGSRQGIAEAETNRAFAQQGGQLAAQLRQQGFNTALGAAQGQQGQQLAAAGQLGNLAQQGFNMGQSINQQQQQFGTMQQAINQALIDAARAQYRGFTGAPMASLSAPLAAVGAANMGQNTSTQTQRPGLFNYLSLGLGAL